MNVPKHFQKCPKISQDFWGRPEDVLTIHQWTYWYHLSDKPDVSEIIDIFTDEDMENTPLESGM